MPTATSLRLTEPYEALMVVLKTRGWRNYLFIAAASALIGIIFLCAILVLRSHPSTLHADVLLAFLLERIALHPLWTLLLSITTCASAAAFSLALLAFAGRLAASAKDARRARESELRLIAAAEASTDAVVMYDCVRSSNGEIVDFKFTFLNVDL